MHLIKLSANKSTFKTVRFNKSGISLIAGEKENNEIHYEDRSYNGVGKSLLVEIIHFCLGSNSNKAFSESMPDWEFTLEFEINQHEFISIRNTSKQHEIFLNEKKYRIKEFNNQLEPLTFSIPSSSQFLSFRSLFPRFMRRNKSAYNDPKKAIEKEEDYQILIRNLFLLGIDIDLPLNKCTLKTERLKLDVLKSNFNKDVFIKNFYTGNKDVSLQINFLEEKIRSLDLNLSEFKIASDYYEIEKSIEKTQQELTKIKNRKTIIENALHNIEKSLQVKPDISKERILAIYEELSSVFKNESLKRIEDVENFNSQIIKNRTNRLSQEKLKLLSQLENLNISIKELSSQLDNSLFYLSDKRALDQYAAVSKQKSELAAQLQKIRDYQALINKIEGNLLDIQKKLADESIKTSQYLVETEKEREEKFSLYSKLVKRVYPNSPAGISLKNNIGNNKLRYDLDVRIEADGSDGINSAKIFCYDLAILLMGCNHNIQFIWHDSRLFSDIDPRQRAILFKLAHEYTSNQNKQYIATVNQDEIEMMRSEFTEKEFEEIFHKNTVLTLKDDKDTSKLLGVKIDMHY